MNEISPDQTEHDKIKVVESHTILLISESDFRIDWNAFLFNYKVSKPKLTTQPGYDNNL